MEISTCTNTFVNCKNTVSLSCTLLSSLLKVKFSGEFCSNIEAIWTILSASWNKTNSSSQTFRFLGDFLGVVRETLKVTDWMYLPQHRSWHFLPRFINFSSKWSIHMTQWAVGNQSFGFTKQINFRFNSWSSRIWNNAFFAQFYNQ